LNGASIQVQRSTANGFLKRTSLMHQRSVWRDACASRPSSSRILLLAPVASTNHSASSAVAAGRRLDLDHRAVAAVLDRDDLRLPADRARASSPIRSTRNHSR
jgi:hypothetical protein